jgi:hypothetical protein
VTSAITPQLQELFDATTAALLEAVKNPPKAGRVDARVLAAAVRHLSNNAISAGTVKEAERLRELASQPAIRRLPFA